MCSLMLGLEKDNFVSNDAGAHPSFAFLVGDFAVGDFTGDESSLALFHVLENRVSETWLEDNNSVPICSLDPVAAFVSEDEMS